MFNKIAVCIHRLGHYQAGYDGVSPLEPASPLVGLVALAGVPPANLFVVNVGYCVAIVGGDNRGTGVARLFVDSEFADHDLPLSLY